MKPAYLKLIIITGLLSLACTTKVSEWVLLNSLPNEYILAYYHKDPVSEVIKKQNTKIGSEISSANIHFRTVLKNDIDKPYMRLFTGTGSFQNIIIPLNFSIFPFHP
jgi:hypothetical protein